MYTYLEIFDVFVRREYRTKIRMIITITTTMAITPRIPPSTPAHIVAIPSVSDDMGGFGIKQSSSVSDSNSTGWQVGSTLNTVPVTVRDGPLLTHDDKSMTKSSAV
jgi:hypothetical protein